MEVLVIFILFILGLHIGSFLNVLADRLPRGEDVVTSRSHCEYCTHKLRWFELIPLVSFVIQNGKSSCCKKALPWQYPLSEFAVGIGFVLLYMFQMHFFSTGLVGIEALTNTGYPITLFVFYYILSIVLFSSLFVIFLTDLKYQIISMEMIVVGSIAAFLRVLTDYVVKYGSLSLTGVSSFITSGYLFSHFIPGIIVGLFFFCLWYFSKGKAMGDGDIYLSALLAFCIGYPLVFVFFYASFLTGAVVGVILILGRKKSIKTHIPFGPFLIWGYMFALIWGKPIMEMWRFI